jgi:hypothetical protein
MQLSSLFNIITIALASGVIAAPVAESSSSDAPILQAREGRECYGLYIKNSRFVEGPLIADCQKLAESIDVNSRKAPALWYSTHGTCNFWPYSIQYFNPYAMPYSYYRPTTVYMSGQDVKDIITEAIRQFGRNGRVSVHGSLECNPDNRLVNFFIRQAEEYD